MSSANLPCVSIVMAVRNEAGFIKATLDSVLRQDYAAGRLEVIVADGMSTDGTRESVQALLADHPNLRLIDNPRKIVSTGLNTAIEQASGDVIVRIDGHCEVAPDFVREAVAILEEHPEAWSVGGPIVHSAATFFGKATAVAMGHPLGVGNASHRFANYEGYAEGAQFPTFRRWVFDRVGKFDEQLVRNQDDELNYRITRAGGKVYLSPRVRYTYYVRERIGQLLRQYFQYGFWRIPVLRKHRRPTGLRQMAPPLFFLALLGLLACGLWQGQPIIAFALPALYAIVLSAAAVAVIPRVGFRVACRVPAAIATMHVGYAFGMLYGVWAKIFHPRAWDCESHMTRMSR